MRECRPHLAAVHGSIINLGSRMAMQGQPGLGMLAAAVEALAGLSRVAAREWLEDGITVNVVCARAATAQFERWAREFPDAQDEALSWIRVSFSRMRRDIMSRARCSRHRRFEGLIA